ncbi:Fic family protein [candidate division WOR-3 bacterium]|nr:Fic family protein [candidate division WOR-3 bacterium]
MAFRPRFSMNVKISNALVDIERVRGFLDAIKIKESWFSQMQEESLREESHHSTHIEGTGITLEQARKIFAGKKVPGVSRDVKMELTNYRSALDYVSKYMGADTLLTEGLIREIHKILVKEVRGNDADPGNYRRVQNYIVNSLTNEIIYTPPPAFDVPVLMKELVDWINSSTGKLSPVIVSGVAQFQFEHIHPFLDGNGRTGRLLSTLILYKTGYDFKRLFVLSGYYDKDRPAYYTALQSVRKNSMDMTGWIEYFVDGLKSQMIDVKSKGEKIIKKEVLLEKTKKLDLNPRQQKILECLVEKNTISRAEYAKTCKISLRTANYDLEDLQAKQLIRPQGIGRAIRYTLILPDQTGK